MTDGWSGSPSDPAGDPYYPVPHPGSYAPPYPGSYPPYPPFAPCPSRPGDERPGTAVASAVLAFIGSGLLVLAGALLLLGASVAASIADTVGDPTSAYAAEFTADGVLDLAAAGLLIAGGVNLLGGRSIGRTLLGAGGGIVLAEGIYWPARFPVTAVPSTIVWDVLFLALAVLALVFAWVPSVSQWLRHAGRRPA